MQDTILRLWRFDTVEILGMTGTVVSPVWQNKIKYGPRMNQLPAVRSGFITILVDRQTVRVDIPDIDDGKLYNVTRWPCGYCNKNLQDTGETVELSPRVTAKVKVCEHNTRYLVYSVMPTRVDSYV